MLPLLVNERRIEPIVIKKANQFVSFNFGYVELLDILIFLGGAPSLDSFLKAYKSLETIFFSYEWFDDPEKLNNTQLPPYETYSNLRNNPLEKNSRPSKFDRWRLDIQKSIIENEIEATTCNWIRKLSKFDQCVWQQENMCP